MQYWKKKGLGSMQKTVERALATLAPRLDQEVEQWEEFKADHKAAGVAQDE